MSHSGPISTPFGQLRARSRDGERIVQLKCPGCLEWGDLDADQLHGRVSVDHTDTGCTYHETHDFAAYLDSLFSDAPEKPLREMTNPRGPVMRPMGMSDPSDAPEKETT